MDVKGRVFVVTGGGNGIGREAVLHLLASGGRVAAVDLREESLEETRALAESGAHEVGELAEVAGRLTTHAVDVTDRAGVQALVDRVLTAHGQVDGLLNVAGVIQPFVPVAGLDYATMQRVMAVNFWGVVHTCQAFLPSLQARPEACVVNVSSMGALAPVPGQSVYGASKAAVKLFTEGLYAECQGTPVRVTIVFPGAIATGITTNSGVTVPGAEARAADAAGSTTPADEAGRQIVTAVEKGPYRMTIGRDATMLDRLSRIAPRRATEMIAKKMAQLIG